MAKTLKVVVESTDFPRPAQFFPTVAAINNLYYALLFSTDPQYKGKINAWTTWMQMGFDYSVREPVRSARTADRVRFTTHSDMKNIELTSTGGNVNILEKEASLLGEIAAARDSAQKAEDDGERSKILAANEKIASQLVKPVRAALEENALRADEMAKIMGMVNDTLTSLTFRNVKSIRASVN